MRIDLTLRDAAGGQDVTVLAAAPLPLARVRVALARAGGVDASAPWWCGGRRLDGRSLVGGAVLRAGSLVHVGSSPAAPRIGYTLDVVSGPSAGRSVFLDQGALRIGRAPDCDLVLEDGTVSRRHATLTVRGSDLHLGDDGSTNGTSVDGVAVPEAGHRLGPGELVRVGDSLLTMSRTQQRSLSPAVTGGAMVVSRAPRRAGAPSTAVIEYPDRPSASGARPVQWLAVLLPALGGVAISVLTHSTVFLLFALLSPVMIACGALGDRLHWRRERRSAAATYRERRATVERRIAEALAAEAAARRRACPDAATLATIATLPGERLWERRRGDPDELAVRIGTANLPATTRTTSGQGTRSARTVRDVPRVVDLRTGPLGLTGPPVAVEGLARWLVAQLAVLHAPGDVELALLLSPETSDRWAWARWLPHFQGRVADSPQACAALVGELTRTVARQRASWPPRDGVRRDPWLVVVVDNGANVPGLTRLLADGPSAGVTAICLDSGASLPAGCASLAEVVGPFGTRVVVRDDVAPILIECVDAAWAERVARALTPLVDVDARGGAALPAACSLLDVLGMPTPSAAAVLRTWSRAGAGAAVVLGAGSDGPVHLDLAADGPHALVAGTTGAGKSELLRSLVAGLALAHPPEDVAFLLVDYKGGAAFAQCARLPHTTGVVTDLDPHLTARALASLEAELRRRERLFAAARVSDLAGFRASGSGEPVPRLVIVVDEFAALAQELPDFVHGLVGVAQRGRSLGIHLVLATQRPGSAVSPDIRANTSLRIALRVTDPAESGDVIAAPDAAGLDRAVPGRAYLRAGDRLTAFQTALVSGSHGAPGGPAVEKLGPWRRRIGAEEPAAQRSDLARIVDAVGGAAAQRGRRLPRSPWLPPLPQVLPTAELGCAAGGSRPGEVPLGLLDDPARQAQPPLTIDLDAPSAILLAGAARTGRTTALLGVAYEAALRHPPGELDIYAVDGGGSLAAALHALAHVATCLGPDDLPMIDRLLERLAAVLVERTGGPPTRSLLLVDGWDRVLAAVGDAPAVALADLLTATLHSGPGGGLTTIVTGDRSLLAPRFAGAFDERLVLQLTDRQDFALAGVPPGAVPQAMPPGRGVRARDGLEFQLTAPTNRGRAEAAIAAAWARRTGKADAVRLAALPSVVPAACLPRDGRLYLGLGGDDARPLALDPFAGSRQVLVAGPPRSGRSTTLLTLLEQARAARLHAVVAGSPRSPLVRHARSIGARVITPDASAATVGAAPATRSLLLVDDGEQFADTAAGDALLEWSRDARADLAIVLAGRSDELAATFRGLGAQIRRSRCGLVLRPGPVDGDLLGVRLAPGQVGQVPPGRGVVVGEPGWGPAFADGKPIPIQVAFPPQPEDPHAGIDGPRAAA